MLVASIVDIGSRRVKLRTASQQCTSLESWTIVARAAHRLAHSAARSSSPKIAPSGRMSSATCRACYRQSVTAERGDLASRNPASRQLARSVPGRSTARRRPFTNGSMRTGSGDVRVVPNKFPAVMPAGDDRDARLASCLEGELRPRPRCRRFGAHEVIIESPRHVDRTVGAFRAASCATCWKPMPQRLRHWRDGRPICLRAGVQEPGSAGRCVARASAQPARSRCRVCRRPWQPSCDRAEHRIPAAAVVPLLPA